MPQLNIDFSPIAVIGMAGRFPGAAKLDDIWKNLADGVDSLTSFSDEEILRSGVDPALLADPNYVKKGSVLENAEFFDAAFFGYSPREAQVIDPQQRVFLECAWEALEDAGYAGENGDRAIGVYAGASINTYIFSNLLRNPEVLQAVGPYQLMLASDKDFLATRVAYKMNLRGPAMTVQTACSTSLVAVQTACQSLVAGQCDIALAGGVSVTYPTKAGYLYNEGMIFSPDGLCRPFDAQAGGIRGGAGAGLVVLKRLEDAIRDRDSIRAVIKGAAINNDGSGKVGYTAPSVEGQARVVEAAQAMAGFDPDSIGYVEAHGTATPLGDPIEIAALERVFRARTSRKGFCAIGSVKSNIGHLDAAAGVAGLIKTVLALQHREIPASLHYREPNKQIDFAESPFFVNSAHRAWESESGPRRAGVSSFGIGGTNAHVVLEEAPERAVSSSTRALQLLVLSAKSGGALRNANTNLAHYLSDHPEISAADAAYTLQTGRRRFPHRSFVVCESRDEAVAALSKAGESGEGTVQESVSRPVAFVFSGQGSQHLNMAAALYRSERAFSKHLDECAELLIPHLRCDLREVIYGAGARSADGPDEERINETWLTQPALFAVEYSLAKMWMAWGILPDACLGHSIGEYVAACLAGVFSLSDGLALVSRRGALMQAQRRGSMLAIALPAEEVRRRLGPDLSIAAVNTFKSCTVSGPTPAIARLERELLSRGVRCTRVPTSHAFHSAMMDPAAEAFLEVVRKLRLTPPNLPFVSNLTGSWIRPDEAVDPGYWALHLRNTVRFADGLQRLLDDPSRILLEVGPGQTLSSFAREIAGTARAPEILASLPHRHDSQPADRFAMQTLGRIWSCGGSVDWEGFHAGEALYRVSLPAYPFERKPYYVEPTVSYNAAFKPAASEERGSIGRKQDISDWFYVPTWKRSASDAASIDGAKDLNSGLWLLFTDEGSGLGATIGESLSGRGAEFVTVYAGERFERRADGTYVIAPGNREHYLALLEELNRSGLVPRRILHLWNVTGSPGGGRQIGDGRDSAFYSPLYLAQAWYELFGGKPLTFVAAADGLQSVCSTDEIVEPMKSLLLGPCKVIPQEHPEIACLCVDIGSGTGVEQVASRLVREASQGVSSGVAAYRLGRRWEQTYEPVRIERSDEAPLRLRGAYLITGGLGGIGLTLARHLARTVQARLVLTARSPLPPREQWDAWIDSHGDADRVSAKIGEIRALEDAGAEVLIAAADVSRLDEMKQVFELARQRFGGINGVIHAAGVAGAGLIQLKSREMAERVFASKVDGTHVLETLLRDEEHVDFLLLCSSINALLGGIGAVDYCSANAFQDAFAESRAGFGGYRTISVNWDTWQEVGMAVDARVPADMVGIRDQNLQWGIKPDEGVEAFRRVLGTQMPQVGVIVRDLPALAELARRPAAAGIPEKRDAAAANQPQPSKRVDAGKDNTGSEVEAAIGAIWCELLGIPEVGVEDNFFDLGGHSLLATGILSRIRATFGVNLPIRVIFDSPTVRALAFLVEARLWREKAAAQAIPDNEGEREEIEL